MGYEVELIVDPDPKIPLEERKIYRFSGDVVLNEIPSECTVYSGGSITVDSVGGMARLHSDGKITVNGWMHGSLATMDAKGDILIHSGMPEDVDIISREGNIRVSSSNSRKAKLTAEKGSIFFDHGYHDRNDLFVYAPNGAVVVNHSTLECRTLEAQGVHVKGSLYCHKGNIGKGGLHITNSLMDGSRIYVSNGGIEVKENVGERCFIEANQGNIDVGRHVGENATIHSGEGNVFVTFNASNNSMISAPKGNVQVGGRLNDGAIIKAYGNITVGTAEPGSWCETHGDFNGNALPGAYVKANQPEIKDYRGKPNSFARLRAREYKVGGPQPLCR